LCVKDLELLFSHVRARDNKISVAEVVYPGKLNAAKKPTGFASVIKGLPEISK